MRIINWLCLILLLTLTSTAMIVACDDDDDDEEETVDCRTPLTIYYEQCDFAISFDDVEDASFSEALDSCAHGSGKMWNMFIHCYRTGYLHYGDDCQAWADCLPEHGFDTGDDDTTDDDVTDDDAADDDAVDDDATDDDAVDDDLIDDDAADDDTAR